MLFRTADTQIKEAVRAKACERHTVNEEIFVQHIFSRFSRRALSAREFDVSENYYHIHNRTNTNNWHVCENYYTLICFIALDVRKISLRGNIYVYSIGCSEEDWDIPTHKLESFLH